MLVIDGFGKVQSKTNGQYCFRVAEDANFPSCIYGPGRTFVQLTDLAVEHVQRRCAHELVIVCMGNGLEKVSFEHWQNSLKQVYYAQLLKLRDLHVASPALFDVFGWLKAR